MGPIAPADFFDRPADVRAAVAWFQRPHPCDMCDEPSAACPTCGLLLCAGCRDTDE